MIIVKNILNWIWRIPEKIDSNKTTQKPNLNIPLLQLVRDYFDNTLVADKKYKQQVIQTTGNVHLITEEIGTLVLYLDSGEGLVRFECANSERGVCSKLSRGDRVIIKGVVNGLFIGNIVVTGSRIIDQNDVGGNGDSKFTPYNKALQPAAQKRGRLSADVIRLKGIINGI